MKPGERTPEFLSTQPEFSHRSLANNTLLAGPLSTPTHIQLMKPSPFAETSQTYHLHAISPTDEQADSSSTGWSPAFQQNIFLLVDDSFVRGGEEVM